MSLITPKKQTLTTKTIFSIFLVSVFENQSEISDYIKYDLIQFLYNLNINT
jgi:hypothetical protein